MNEEGRLILRLAVGLYLVYLAYMLIRPDGGEYRYE